MGKIVSTFKEKPKSRIAWRAMWLGLATILIGPILGIFAAVIRPIIDKVAGPTIGIPFGFTAVILTFMLSISAIVTGIRALKSGERSYILWIGFIPALLSGAFWIFMIIGELLFPH